MQSDITYEEYQNISAKKHLSNIKQNPVKFLKASGKGFFIEKEAFKEQMKDIIEYRAMEYYRRRYLEKK